MSLAAVEDLIENVEIELAKEISGKYEKHRKQESKQKVCFFL